MDADSAGQAARRLGTTTPRVMRAIHRLRLDVERGPAGRVRISPDQLRRLKAELGVATRIDGLSRLEAQVAAALAKSPRGLVSARAVARRAGVSPSSAAKAIAALGARGLVRREREWVAAGRARQVDVIRASVSAHEWTRLAPFLAQVTLPLARAAQRPHRVPSHLRHLFWNADLGRLTTEEHGGYIADRLVTSGDLDGLAWGARALRPSHWLDAARDRGLTEPERTLADNLAVYTRR